MPSVPQPAFLIILLAALRLASGSTEPVDAQSEPSRVLLGPGSTRIGLNAVGEAEEFGLIAAAVFLPSGVAVISDLAKQRLVVVPRSGERPSTFGRAGSGPGEMKEPSSLFLLDSTELVLLDRALARLSIFRPITTGIRYVRSVTLKAIPDDLCASGNEFVALRFDAPPRTILHRVSTAGQEIFAFGTPLFAASDFLNMVSTQGRLLCLRDRQAVVIAPLLTGELRSYAVSGRLLWRTQLREHLPPEVKEVQGGGILFGWHPKGVGKSHVGMSAVRLDSLHFLVQFGLRTREQRGYRGEDFAEIDSRILRIQDGIEIGRQNDLPLILATNGSLAVTTGEEPEPWIAVREYRLMGAKPESKPR